jgi:hypothetical protein
MSHLVCNCVYSISDITDFLPYKAYFLPDEDTNESMDKVLAEVAEFIEARERGEQERYERKRLSIPLSEHALRTTLFHLFSHPISEFGRWMYECEGCGRIWMQARPERNDWVSYLPESARRGVLRHEGAAPDE